MTVKMGLIGAGGISGAHLSALAGMKNVTVVATGGLAPLISDVSETIDHVEELLTLEGLVTIFERITAIE